MLFYLKINRNEGYSIRNLKQWIDTINIDNNNEYIIICDNDSLKERVKKDIPNVYDNKFITSNRDEEEIVKITKNNTSDFWNNASYSHLTTFYDAKNKQVDEFWNIDADDTCFCMPIERINEILKRAREESKKRNIDAFSFDMSHSRRNGGFWSFGVTYTNNKKDWFREMIQHCNDDYFNNRGYKEANLPYCIDTYFTYLNDVCDLNMGTFYVENCKFVHYSNDFIYRPWCSWFAIYRNGRIIKPLLRDFYELESVGNVEISKDVVKIDIGLNGEEQTKWLINNAAEFQRNKDLLLEDLKNHH